MEKLMDFGSFMQWAFLGLVSAGVLVLWQMRQSMSDMHVDLKLLLAEQMRSRKDIDDHENRLRDIEKQRG